MSKKTLLLLAFCLFATVARGGDHKNMSWHDDIIVTYLEGKSYGADKDVLTEADLKIPERVDGCLTVQGLSAYTLLRNEPFARHGYIFKDPVLQRIFSYTAWYKPNPDFRFGQLSKMEKKNVDFIKTIETTYDYGKIAKAVTGLENNVKQHALFATVDSFFSHDVVLSLNHVRLNESRLLRNVIFARHGYTFKEPVLREIFSRCSWYSPKTGDLSQVSADMSKNELIDVELLKKKEWVEILDSVNITLPSDVFFIPVVGYNALYLRKLDYKGQIFYYSSPFLSSTEGIGPDMFDNHKMNANDLVSPEVLALIKGEKDPAKKLVIFFDKKKYKGYVDKVLFNHSDMEIPYYLTEAVKATGVDYRILLRKEIHARNGAKFTDKKSGAIFAQCHWYQPRYNLTSRTMTRFPAEVEISTKELNNFALLEGEELGPKALLHKKQNMVVDLNGNLYFIKVSYVHLPGTSRGFKFGSDFPSLEAYEAGDLQGIANQIFNRYKFDPKSFEEQESKFVVVGC